MVGNTGAVNVVDCIKVILKHYATIITHYVGAFIKRWSDSSTDFNSILGSISEIIYYTTFAYYFKNNFKRILKKFVYYKFKNQRFVKNKTDF